MKTIGKILIVSANTGLAQEILEYFVAHKYEINIEKNMDDSRAFLSGKRVDLILFDYVLGDAEGKKAVLSGLPVIFILSSDCREILNQVYNIGAKDFIVTPIINKVLLTRVESQLRIVKGNVDVEKANKELYNFCMPASHDLKAPFNVIAELSSLMADELGEKINNKIEYLLTCISRTAVHITELIESGYNHAQAEYCNSGGYIRTTKNLNTDN